MITMNGWPELYEWIEFECGRDFLEVVATGAYCNVVTTLQYWPVLDQIHYPGPYASKVEAVRKSVVSIYADAVPEIIDAVWRDSDVRQ